MNNARTSVACVAVVLAGLSSPVLAARVEFAVDSTASRVTLTGAFQGHALAPQSAGSDTTAYTGVLPADLTDGKLTLYSTGPASVYSPTPQRPSYPDPAGTQQASYGFTFETQDGTAYASIRRLYLYLGNEYGPPTDVSGGTFVPADAGFFVSDGGFDVALPGAEAVREVDLHGYGAPNSAAGPGTLTTNGSVQTLTIPLDSTFTVSSGDLTLSLNGQIVATRAVPEPGAAALFAAGMAAFGLRRRRA